MDKIIVGVIIGCITSAFAVYLANISSERRRRLEEFNKAAAEFRIAFIPELRFLDYRYTINRADSPGIYKTLSNAFNRHEIAIIKFRPFLNRYECIGLNKAWSDYCDKKDGKPHFMVYGEPENIFDRAKKQKFYLKKLNILLNFANQKHYAEPFT